MSTAAISASASTSTAPTPANAFAHPDRFVERHVGPDAEAQAHMLCELGYANLDACIDDAVPQSIRRTGPLDLPAALSEAAVLTRLRELAGENQVFRSYLGLGYHDCLIPPVIQRNLFENPGWYTQYTPYQAEIAQGRLEGLLNFQTMICDLTALPVANASLLDEATAAAEAMTMARAAAPAGRTRFAVAADCHPQTIGVLRTRAEPLGIVVDVVATELLTADESTFGVLLQYPGSDGAVRDPRLWIAAAKVAGAVVIVAADLLALCLLTPPGALGADIAIGSAQRFGVPLGYGGPHAAFLACREDFRRQLPGRIVGLSKDVHGHPALRLALQTREQHIRREKATSNICTAQALLANMAVAYAIYHGPVRLRAIAARVHHAAATLAAGAKHLGHHLIHAHFFDTLRLRLSGSTAASVVALAAQHRINLRALGADEIVIALDETVTEADVVELLTILGGTCTTVPAPLASLPTALARSKPFLTHPVFNSHHSETAMLRYLRALEAKDLSLCHSMIPLGSCTMKLNATVEMAALSWPEFNRLHPFAPPAQAAGYAVLFAQLAAWLADITGFAAVSLQPNAGSQGEYAGLLAIRRWHASRNQAHRDVCLIPTSAHGTNPASATMVGLRVVTVACDAQGNVDLTDLRAKIAAHADKISCLMVTYPSTHGVFEESIREIAALVHAAGGQVYMDGANLNAQVGLTSPGLIGADVCHLNLHKTFCIPHGGGGPGMGPIGVASHLAPFLPGDPRDGVGAVSAAPWGSASILIISWAYIALMGPAGLTDATRVAILSANYIAKRLSDAYPVLYRGARGLVAHECILDLRPFKAAGVEVEDVAKRLMDYGFHAPTMSFPVPGTLMIEPTESEPLPELDRFIDAMRRIRDEIRAVAEGRSDRADNPLKHAPHTAAAVTADAWPHGYSRAQAAFPAPWVHARKFWPSVGRIDNAFGDRHLICTCPSIESYETAGGATGDA